MCLVSTPEPRPVLLHTHPMPAAELASFCGRCRWHQYQVRPQDRAIAVAKPCFCKTNPPAKCEVERQPKKRRICKTNTPRTCVDGSDLGRGKCSDLGVPAPYGHNSAPMRIYHRQGRLIGESQERVARASPLTGDEVEQLVDLASIGWKSPLDRLLRSRMATRPFQFTGMEKRHTPKSELLPVEAWL